MAKNFEWKSELGLIQSVLRKSINGQDSKDIAALSHNEPIDWEKLVVLLNYHELSPFMYVALKPHRDLLPEKIYQLLCSHYWVSIRNNLVKEREYRIVHDAFQKEEVGLMPIKGTALMWDLDAKYSTIRPMGDIDALIRGTDYSKAAEVLQQVGYKKNLGGLTENYWLNNQCHVSFLKQNEAIRLDLHFRLDFRRDNKDVLPLVWERNRRVDVDGRSIQLLSPEDTLFSLALHQRRFGKMFCLKYVLDTALLLRKSGEEFDWDYVFSECKKNSLFCCVYFLLLQVKLFLDYGTSNTNGSPSFPLSEKRKERMARFISKEMNALDITHKSKANYLKAHFLLYDSYSEPVRYIMNIPQEQFARFYGLEPYSLRTRFSYKFRFPYIIFNHAAKLLNRPKN